jgi:hypothetical protein
MEVAIVGRQVQTRFGGRIDLLAIDRSANCVILELKRGRTPRDVVAQVLDYATWVKDLGYAELDQMSLLYRKKSLNALFENIFGMAIPDTVNDSHAMVIVASELDESSERIISYLAEECDVNINAVFFRFFRDSGVEHLGRAWLKDPIETLERSESKKHAPWSGYWFVNAGEGEHRNWDDNRQYGYVGAGQGPRCSRALLRLHPADQIFVYVKGFGYVGRGVVTREAAPSSEFVAEPGGKPLLQLPLRAPKASENLGSPELAEWAVGIRWLSTVPREQAKTFRGIFANQNIVCKLSDPKTVEFLLNEFPSPEDAAHTAVGADGASPHR